MGLIRDATNYFKHGGAIMVRRREMMDSPEALRGLRAYTALGPTGGASSLLFPRESGGCAVHEQCKDEADHRFSPQGGEREKP